MARSRRVGAPLQSGQRTSFSVSPMSASLMDASSGVSIVNDGLWFTCSRVAGCGFQHTSRVSARQPAREETAATAAQG